MSDPESEEERVKVGELKNHGFRELTVTEPDREIVGVYIGDLLSWVMGRCTEDNAWITIMSNVNVIAVASLANPSVVVLTEDVVLPDDLVALASSKNVNVVTTELSSYEAAVVLHGLTE